MEICRINVNLIPYLLKLDHIIISIAFEIEKMQVRFWNAFNLAQFKIEFKTQRIIHVALRSIIIDCIELEISHLVNGGFW